MVIGYLHKKPVILVLIVAHVYRKVYGFCHRGMALINVIVIMKGLWYIVLGNGSMDITFCIF